MYVHQAKKVLAKLTVTKSNGYQQVTIPQFPKKMMPNEKAQKNKTRMYQNKTRMYQVTARTDVP